MQFNRLSKNIWILGFGSLLTDVSTEMIHAVLPVFLVSSLGASMFMVGLIEGFGEATASIFKVFSGVLSDRFARRKPLIVIGYAVSTLVKPMFALASTSNLVLTARIGDRIGKGIRVAPRDALVADCTSADQRGAAYGLRQSLDTVGAIVGPLVVLLLLSLYANNFRLVFWIALVPALAAVFLLMCGIQEPARQPISFKSKSLQFKSLHELSRSYWWLLAVACLFNLGNSSDAFLLLKAKQLCIGNPFIPLVLILFNISYALTAYPAGILSDRLGRRALFITGLVLYALIYFGLGIAAAQWQLWLLCVFYGIQLGLSQGTLLAIVADEVPEHLRGTAFGFLNLAIGVALLPASMLAGYLWQQFSPAPAFFAGAAFSTAALVLYLFASNE